MPATAEFVQTACILCSENCGLEILIEDGHFTRIKGDKKNPTSQGYLCEKASTLDHYQNHNDRLKSPLRRRADGSFEEISWDDAVSEIAGRIVALREEHGPKSLAFYGGAGQGNQLALAYAVGFRMAMGTPYMYHALAQEKTGEFWLDGRLYGSQANHTFMDIAGTSCVMFSGTNPWHAHGFPRARKRLRDMAKDPDRTIIVMDPRRTETAELADIHLQVRPGTDAFAFAAMIGTLVQEDLVDREFLEQRTVDYPPIEAAFRDIPVDKYAERAGLDPELLRRATRTFAAADGACVRSDLGLQQSMHSTLNLYLEKLLTLLTGNFGRKGGNNIHAYTLPLLWHTDETAPDFDELRSGVNGMKPIASFYPPNLLPSEIDTDHPDRLRGVVIDSANPAITGANSQAFRDALPKLDLLVVIDVAMTESAELADYILPASSQFEKYDCTFFHWGFPTNHLHVRHPILPRFADSLPEQEIYMRLVRAMGTDLSQNPLLGGFEQLKQHPAVQQLPEDMRAAVAPLLYASMGFCEQHAAAVERAGITDEGDGLPAALFKRIITSKSGTEISVHEYEDTFSFIAHEDGKIHLTVPEMLEWLADLDNELEQPLTPDTEYPYMLCAGERRSSNATTNFRDPESHKKDPAGFIRVHPKNAEELGLAGGDTVRCITRQGELTTECHIDDTVQPGVCSMPHGFGLRYTGDDGTRRIHGPVINLLTSTDHCDPLTKTPYHKNVPVRLEKA